MMVQFLGGEGSENSIKQVVRTRPSRYTLEAQNPPKLNIRQGSARAGPSGSNAAPGLSSRPGLQSPPLHRSPAPGTRTRARGCPGALGSSPAPGLLLPAALAHTLPPGGIRPPPRAPSPPHAPCSSALDPARGGSGPGQPAPPLPHPPPQGRGAPLPPRGFPYCVPRVGRARDPPLLRGPDRGHAPARSPGHGPPWGFRALPLPPGRGSPRLPRTRRAMPSTSAVVQSSHHLTSAAPRPRRPASRPRPSRQPLGGAAGAGRKTLAKPWPRLIGPGRLRSFAWPMRGGRVEVTRLGLAGAGRAAEGGTCLGAGLASRSFSLSLAAPGLAVLF